MVDAPPLRCLAGRGRRVCGSRFRLLLSMGNRDTERPVPKPGTGWTLGELPEGTGPSTLPTCQLIYSAAAERIRASYANRPVVTSHLHGAQANTEFYFQLH